MKISQGESICEYVLQQLFFSKIGLDSREDYSVQHFQISVAFMISISIRISRFLDILKMKMMLLLASSLMRKSPLLSSKVSPVLQKLKVLLKCQPKIFKDSRKTC